MTLEQLKHTMDRPLVWDVHDHGELSYRLADARERARNGECTDTEQAEIIKAWEMGE